MNNAEKFKQIFGLYATELWSMPEGDFLAWLNRDVETTQIDHTADIGKKVDGDCISRQAVVKFFNDWISCLDENCHHQSVADMTIIKNDFKNLPSVQPEQVCVANVTLTDEQVKEVVEKAKNAVISVIEPEPHWIPCSERLPEKNCRCLTTNEAWGSFEVDWNAWIDGRWLYPNEKPIAWMPLPEPYRGGEKE